METNNNNDPRGNTQVEKLWKDYEAARKADRPQKALDILQDIKRLAVSKTATFGFCIIESLSR